MKRQSLMIQGTTSDAGKSMLVTALCRYLKRRQVLVAPFKPQNMALNSAVAIDGGEIGRAQAVQAFACGAAPTIAMNPVLLKPNSDTGSQVIVNGKAIGNMNAAEYHYFKPTLLQVVVDAYRGLLEDYQFVVIEGAGSPAEINLREHDIANMGFAEAVDCPVLLIADIDRGGVFAHIVGTLALLSESERRRVIGVVINRFRGDIKLLNPGIRWLEERIGKPVLGVLPYLNDLYLEAEDSLANPLLQACRQQNGKKANSNSFNTTANAGSSRVDKLRVAVIALPKISNHTDFDALQQHPAINITMIKEPDDLLDQAVDLIIIPGTKNTRQDLAWLKAQSWQSFLLRHLRYGGKLIGICGGFQMLGQYIHDPDAVESEAGSSEGLGLLDFETRLAGDKKLKNVKGKLSFADAEVIGYEIHVGESQGPALRFPALHLDDGDDGAISEDNQILGCYVHGLFDQPQASQAILRWCGADLDSSKSIDMAAQRNQTMERLADMIEQHMDMAALADMLEWQNLSVNEVAV